MRTLAILLLSITLLSWNQGALLAGEHGGTKMGTSSEHGGGAMMEGSHGSEEDVATIKQAADALRATNPDLAKKLDEIAKKAEM